MKFGIVRNNQTKFLTWFPWLPATVPMQDIPLGTGKGDPIKISSAWWHFIEAVNNPAGYKYARSIGMNWINTSYDKDTPYSPAKGESIIDAGNFISYDEEQGGHILVRSFMQLETPMFDPALINWRTRPYLFQKATCTNYTRQLRNVTSGIDAYMPLIARNDGGGTGELWLPDTCVEKFADVPFYATVVAPAGLRVRTTYSTNADILYVLAEGAQIVITAYRLVGASVWGQALSGWVCLLYADVPNTPRVFTTNWKLKSPGVVPAAIV